MAYDDYQAERDAKLHQIDAIDRDRSRDVDARRADIIALYAEIAALDAAFTATP